MALGFFNEDGLSVMSAHLWVCPLRLNVLPLTTLIVVPLLLIEVTALPLPLTLTFIAEPPSKLVTLL